MPEYGSSDVALDDVNLSEVRRHGWTVRTLSRAVAALASEVGPGPADRPATIDEEAARELLRWLDRATVQDQANERPHEKYTFAAELNYHGEGLPPVLPRHAALAEILSAPATSHLARLREVYGDPTPVLIDLANDLTPDEWSGDEELPAPHRAALGALAEIGTVEVVRYLVGRFDPLPAEYVWEVLQRALERVGAAILEPALELWPSASDSARGYLVEALCQAGVRDDRIFARLVEWIDEEEHDAVLALGVYGDPRAVPHLRRVLERARARDADGLVGDIVDCLSSLGNPTEEGRHVGA